MNAKTKTTSKQNKDVKLIKRFPNGVTFWTGNVTQADIDNAVRSTDKRVSKVEDEAKSEDLPDKHN